MLGAVRPVLELLEVGWAEEEDTSNNSAINPDTGAIKVRHQHLHLQMLLHMHLHSAHAHAQVQVACSMCTQLLDPRDIQQGT